MTVISNIRNFLISKQILARKVVPIDQGTTKSTFKIESDKRDFIVKLFDKSKKSYIEDEISHLRRIHKYENVTIFPLNAKPIRIGNKIGYYYKYFKGKRITESKISNIFFTFGKFVANFDLILRKIPQPKKEFYFWEETHENKIQEAIVRLKKKRHPFFLKIMHALEEGYDLLKKESKKEDFSKCRTQLVHGDLHFDNVLYDEHSKKFFIIDTSGLSPGILAKEIIVMIGYAFVDKNKKINKKAISELLRGYTSIIKLNKIEKKLMPLLLIKRKIGELTFLLNQLKEKIVSRKDFDKYHKNSLRNLKVAVKEYPTLKTIFH